MCNKVPNEILTLISSTISGLFVGIVASILTFLGIKKQILNNPKQLKICMNNVENIFKNLNLLIEGIGHLGSFIPSIEYKCKKILSEESNESNTISIAQRLYQFNSFGEKIIWSCLKFMLLISEKEMPKTYKVINEIFNYLEEPKNSQKIKQRIKISHEIMSSHTIYFKNSSLDQKSSNKLLIDSNVYLNETKEKLQEFKNKIPDCALEEFPKFKQK